MKNRKAELKKAIADAKAEIDALMAEAEHKLNVLDELEAELAEYEGYEALDSQGIEY